MNIHPECLCGTCPDNGGWPDCLVGDDTCPMCGHPSLKWDHDELVWFCLVCEYVEQSRGPGEWPRWAGVVNVVPNPNYL